MSRQTGLPRLNLKRALCASLDVHFDVPQSIHGAKHLSKFVERDEGFFVRLTGRGKGRQLLMANVLRPGDAEKNLLVRFLVEAEPPPLEERGTFAHLFDALALIETELPAHCSARFEYPVSFATPVLTIPFKPLVRRPDSFDEIRGVRAIKLDEKGGVKYSVIVDSYDMKTLSHDVFCKPTLNVSDARFLNAALNLAKQISDSFFIERTRR